MEHWCRNQPTKYPLLLTDVGCNQLSISPPSSCKSSRLPSADRSYRALSLIAYRVRGYSEALATLPGCIDQRRFPSLWLAGPKLCRPCFHFFLPLVMSHATPPELLARLRWLRLRIIKTTLRLLSQNLVAVFYLDLCDRQEPTGLPLQRAFLFSVQ